MENILFFFDIIVDTDIGIIKFLEQNYNSNDYFDIPKDDIIKRYKLLYRDYKNPITSILQKDVDVDKLYTEIIENEYESILNYSDKTMIKSFIDTILRSNLHSISIFCKNVYEEQIINNLFNNINIVKEINIDNYDYIYIKDIYSLPENMIMKGKNLYIADLKYNFRNHNEFILNNNFQQLYGIKNNIYIIDIYNIDKPKG